MTKIVKKWKPVLEAVKCQKEREVMVACCLENTLNYYKMISQNDSDDKFDVSSIPVYAIPFVARVLSKITIPDIVDCNVMTGPIGFTQTDDREILEAFNYKLHDYYIKGMSENNEISMVDLNTIASLTIDDLDWTVLDKLKTQLMMNVSDINCHNITNDMIGDANVIVASSKMAYKIINLFCKEDMVYGIKNDENQVLSFLIDVKQFNNDKSLKIYADNSAVDDYVIIGHRGNGDAIFMPYLPLRINHKNETINDREINIAKCSSRIALEFKNAHQSYKMYIDKTTTTSNYEQK